MATLVVTYPAQDGAHFDLDYYIDRHLPLVRDTWSKHGLTDARALIPDEVAPAYAAIALLEFSDAAAIDRALGSPEAGAVFGDVTAFTNIAPVPMRAQ
ncbi:MAG: EthD family reductase [Sphingomonas sp.]|jgi:uncharacterized protein (TIGR02118 family)|uniref:EthD family reductase n=1 Tax=Sphingomonas sp. TaxID=28214 RepID=UPI00356A1BCA